MNALIERIKAYLRNYRTVDEALYELVAKEITSNDIHLGTWIKSFADADGDANKAQALYMRRRVAALKQELQFTLREQELGKLTNNTAVTQTQNQIRSSKILSWHQIPPRHKR